MRQQPARTARTEQTRIADRVMRAGGRGVAWGVRQTKNGRSIERPGWYSLESEARELRSMLQVWPPRCMDANRHTATDGRANDARAHDGAHASGAMDGRRVLRLTRHGEDRRKQKPDDLRLQHIVRPAGCQV